MMNREKAIVERERGREAGIEGGEIELEDKVARGFPDKGDRLSWFEEMFGDLRLRH